MPIQSYYENIPLTVITRTDVLEDPKGRRVMGMLLSDEHQIAWRGDDAPPATEYKFVRPNSPPIDTGITYLYMHDPPPPDEDETLVNKVLPAVFEMAVRGAWEAKTNFIQSLRYWICLVAIAGSVGVMGMSVLGMGPQPVAVVTTPTPEEAPTAQELPSTPVEAEAEAVIVPPPVDLVAVSTPAPRPSVATTTSAVPTSEDTK